MRLLFDDFSSAFNKSLLHDPLLDRGLALKDFIKWCEDNFLYLNVTKTKQLIIDFRNNSEESKQNRTAIFHI